MVDCTAVFVRPDLLVLACARRFIAALPEIMASRIGTRKWIVSNVSVLVESLRVFEMSPKLIGRHEPPHVAPVIARAEVI